MRTQDAGFFFFVVFWSVTIYFITQYVKWITGEVSVWHVFCSCSGCYGVSDKGADLDDWLCARCEADAITEVSYSGEGTCSNHHVNRLSHWYSSVSLTHHHVSDREMVPKNGDEHSWPHGVRIHRKKHSTFVFTANLLIVDSYCDQCVEHTGEVHAALVGITMTS